MVKLKYFNLNPQPQLKAIKLKSYQQTKDYDNLHILTMNKEHLILDYLYSIFSHQVWNMFILSRFGGLTSLN